MHTMIKLIMPGVLLSIPALALAHSDHTHGNSLLLSLLHPFTGVDHLIGLFLLGLVLYVARHQHTWQRWIGAICVLFIPLLFSYSLSTTTILAMDAVCLGLLAWLRNISPAMLRLES